ncbi:MAG: cation/H(+) antiporter, partial [Chitinophagaceae bacterium]
FIEKVEDVSIVLLLPLFFVFTGLRTEIGLLNDPELWKLTGIIILIAVTGKFVGSALAARFVGQNWKDSLSLGALMNTRGLMELVVLNIGYDLKVLTPEVFSMMVIMALVTTFMTGPALDVINWAFRSKTLKMAEDIPDVSKYRILFSFAKPESGKGLLKLADSLTHESSEDVTLTALHLAPLDELQHFNTDEYEKECFKPVVEESIALDREIITMFKASVDIDNEITHVANKGQYDLLLIGLGESIYEGTLLGKLLGFTTSIINPEKLINTVTGKENIFESWPIDDQTRQILAKSHVPVGIFINKSFSKAQRVFIPIFDEDDIFLVKYARRLIRNVSATVIILDIGEHVKFDAKMKESIRAIEQTTPNHITIYGKKTIDKNFLAEQDLMIVSMESWRKLVDNKSLWLSDVPSALIVSESQQLQ